MSSPHAISMESCATVSGFLQRLHIMLSHEANHAFVTWSADGRSFVVHDVDGLEAHVLGRYFNHSKIASLARQLNMYGFRKLPSPPGRTAFAHAGFVRDQPALLTTIKRARKGAAPAFVGSAHAVTSEQRATTVCTRHAAARRARDAGAACGSTSSDGDAPTPAADELHVPLPCVLAGVLPLPADMNTSALADGGRGRKRTRAGEPRASEPRASEPRASEPRASEPRAERGVSRSSEASGIGMAPRHGIHDHSDDDGSGGADGGGGCGGFFVGDHGGRSDAVRASELAASLAALNAAHRETLSRLAHAEARHNALAEVIKHLVGVCGWYDVSSADVHSCWASYQSAFGCGSCPKAVALSAASADVDVDADAGAAAMTMSAVSNVIGTRTGVTDEDPRPRKRPRLDLKHPTFLGSVAAGSPVALFADGGDPRDLARFPLSTPSRGLAYQLPSPAVLFL